ncbi:MAG: DpnD/PcfM family protein [Christensenellales bacterium]|jgi:hypothetical protein
MKEFKVEIKETLVMTVAVEAESAAQAREISERNWKNSEYILDADYFQGVSFTVPPRNRDLER